MKAMSPENLTSAFKKFEIHPFDKSVIFLEQVASSIIHRETQEPEQAQDSDADSDSTVNYPTVPATSNSPKQAPQLQKTFIPTILKK